jgi:acetyl-CoA carboxylase carboxyl transferase subunit beta
VAENISVDITRVSDGEPVPAEPAPRTRNTCPECGSHYREDEMVANLRVCARCGHHFPVTARERIVQLADEGSWSEIARNLRSSDPLGFVDSRPYPERVEAAEQATGLRDAVLVGEASIGGQRVVLAVMDFTFLGGSMGSVVGEKFLRAADLAVAERVPMVSVAASGGARMQEGVLALMQMAKTVAAVDALREARQPYISVLAHPTTGGVAASFAALGDVIIAEPGALLSFSGPRVVKQTTREDVPDDFGLAESNYRHGHVDMIVPRPELRDQLARAIALLSGGSPYRIPSLPGEIDAVGAVGRALADARRRLGGIFRAGDNGTPS